MGREPSVISFAVLPSCIPSCRRNIADVHPVAPLLIGSGSEFPLEFFQPFAVQAATGGREAGTGRMRKGFDRQVPLWPCEALAVIWHRPRAYRICWSD